MHQFRGAYQGDIFRSDFRAAVRAPEPAPAATPMAAAPESTPPEVEPLESPAPTIHRWVDEAGRVHFGDRWPGDE